MDVDLREIAKLLSNEAVEISFVGFAMAMVVAGVLSYLIKLTYGATSQTLSNRDYFSDIFVPLGLVTCLVITVVKTSLALSLGLVGALSIVRFRAAIKEPEELVYLFFVIGVGIAAGANQIGLAIIATALIVAACFAFRYLRENRPQGTAVDTNVINLRIPKELKVSEVIEQLEPYFLSARVKSWSSNQDSHQLTLWVLYDDEADKTRLLDELPERLAPVEFSFHSRTGIAE